MEADKQAEINADFYDPNWRKSIQPRLEKEEAAFARQFAKNFHGRRKKEYYSEEEDDESYEDSYENVDSQSEEEDLQECRKGTKCKFVRSERGCKFWRNV